MQRAFEKIIERLEEIQFNVSEHGGIDGCNLGTCGDEMCVVCLKKKIIEIVNQVAEEYKQKCRDRSPDKPDNPPCDRVAEEYGENASISANGLKLIEEMAEEIENLYGKETELSNKAREYLNGYGGGWIPVSSGKLPEGGVAVIVSYKDRFLPQADGTCDGWYDEPNRMWHLEDYEYSNNAEVTAWREKLEPYKAESEG